MGTLRFGHDCPRRPDKVLSFAHSQWVLTAGAHVVEGIGGHKLHKKLCMLAEMTTDRRKRGRIPFINATTDVNYVCGG